MSRRRPPSFAVRSVWRMMADAGGSTALQVCASGAVTRDGALLVSDGANGNMFPVTRR